MRLEEKCMLVELHQSWWTGVKVDKRVTDDTNKRYCVEHSAGKYHKTLLTKEQMKAIKSATDEVYRIHRKFTLPWNDGGVRILPTAMYFDYLAAMDKAKEARQKEVDKFIANYQDYITEAQVRLNGMFNSADYPSCDVIRKKFDITIGIFPLPSSDDFRASLNNEEVDAIKKDIEKNVSETANNAVKDVYSRFLDVVSKMAKTLQKDDKIFRNTLTSNVDELIEMLPKLNFTGDSELVSLYEDAKATIYGKDPEELRVNKEERNAIAREAERIANKMKGVLGESV